MTSNKGEAARFPAQLQRLKQRLGLSEDREVAEALGMTPTALSLRKRRDAFPVDKLLQLAAARPELWLDVQYITSGKPTSEHDRMRLARGTLDAPMPTTAAAPAKNRAGRSLPLATKTSSAEVLQLASADRWDAVFESSPRARVPLVAWALVREGTGAPAIKGVVIGPGMSKMYCEDDERFLCYVPRDVPLD